MTVNLDTMLIINRITKIQKQPRSLEAQLTQTVFRSSKQGSTVASLRCL